MARASLKRDAAN